MDNEVVEEVDQLIEGIEEQEASQEEVVEVLGKAEEVVEEKQAINACDKCKYKAESRVCKTCIDKPSEVING